MCILRLWNLYTQGACPPFLCHWLLIQVLKLIINEVILVLMDSNRALVLSWLNMRDIVFERSLANTAMQVVRIWHLHFGISFDIADVTSTEFIVLLSCSFLHLLYLWFVLYADFHLRVCRNNVEINICVFVESVNLEFFFLSSGILSGYYAFIKLMKYLFFPLLNGVRNLEFLDNINLWNDDHWLLIETNSTLWFFLLFS